MAKRISRKELNEMDARRRRKSLRQTIAEITEVLTNTAGFKRIREIADDQWQDAEESDAAQLASES